MPENFEISLGIDNDSSISIVFLNSKLKNILASSPSKRISEFFVV